jgi:hypothetical protein
MDEVHDKKQRIYPIGRTFIRTTVINNKIVTTESNTSNQNGLITFSCSKRGYSMVAANGLP